ncbi:MAG: hypothetical protein LBD73_04985, partial [Deferribacteraceae bacterium]|nr:hypothetical protein [Deferribacteraceae bacterium]
GNDNEKRVNYYFRSNADKNYKAREILTNVHNDTINDAISDSIIDSYSAHGFHEKALEIVNYYIIGSANRIKGFRSIGYFTALYDKAIAKIYLDLGKAYLDSLFEGQKDTILSNSNSIRDYINYYVPYMRGYDKAGDHETADKIRNFIVDDMLGNSTISATSTLNTLWGTRFLTVIYNAIREMIAGGDSENALRTIDYYLKVTQNKLPSVGLTTANLYTLQIAHSSYAAVFYRMLANDTNAEAMKAKIASIKTAVDSYIPNISANNAYRDPLAYLAGPVYWAMGESAANDILTALSSREGAKLQALYEITLAKAEESDFDTALSYYLTNNPLAVSDFSNLNRFIQAFSYFNNWQVGIGVQAHRHGRDDIAEAAADYLAGVLDSAIAYFTAQGVLSDNAGMMITNTSYIYPSYSEYPICSPDDYDGGYLKTASIYSLAGNADKAKETLQKAEAYVDALTAPYTKGQYYSLLGYYYLKLANSVPASEAAYAKAAALLPDISGNEYRLNLNLLLAYNALYRSSISAAGRNTLIDGYLTEASTLADAIYTGGVDDTAAENEAAAFLKIAARYASINEREKVKTALGRAETAAGDGISDPDGRLTQLITIYTDYAKLYSIDTAVEKAEALENLTDINSALNSIATTIAGSDDFPAPGLPYIVSYNVDSGKIAFSDTDKDGKPDFFVPWATAEQIATSGLELDDDIDGDGKPDTEDLTPFFAD